MSHHRKLKRAAKPQSEAPNGEIPYIPALPVTASQPQRRGPGRPKKIVLQELIGSGQLLFLRGAGFDVEQAEFIDRHRLHPVMLDCDAWWNPKTERVLFVNTRPRSEVRFLTFAGVEDRAEHEMRISGLSMYRITGRPAPAWGD